jgi:uncharacterized membrane protein
VINPKTSVALLAALVLVTSVAQAQPPTATLRIHVGHEGAPVAAASVIVNGTAHTSDASGNVVATAVPGRVEILVVKEGFAEERSSLVLVAGRDQAVEVELRQEFEKS